MTFPEYSLCELPHLSLYFYFLCVEHSPLFYAILQPSYPHSITLLITRMSLLAFARACSCVNCNSSSSQQYIVLDLFVPLPTFYQ